MHTLVYNIKRSGQVQKASSFYFEPPVLFWSSPVPEVSLHGRPPLSTESYSWVFKSYLDCPDHRINIVEVSGFVTELTSREVGSVITTTPK